MATRFRPINEKRELFLFGIALGILMIILEVLKANSFRAQTPIEVVVGIVAISFLMVGLWIGVYYLKKNPPKPEVAKNIPNEKLGISAREMEVIELLAQGLSNKEIANELYVSQNTVKTHLSHIFSKLHAKRRTQAIQRARELNLIT